jgi:hypothetical protein
MMDFEAKLQSGYYTKRDQEHYQNWRDSGKATNCLSAIYEFKDDALECLELTNHPKAGLLFDLCWQHGHSSGYQEVWGYLLNWSELLR